MAQSDNGVDIGAVYQLLTQLAGRFEQMSSRMDQMNGRLDNHDGKLDELLDIANEHGRVLHEHARKLDDVSAGLADLRGSGRDYHQTVIGHGRHYTEIEERVRRIERNLKLDPTGT